MKILLLIVLITLSLSSFSQKNCPCLNESYYSVNPYYSHLQGAKFGAGIEMLKWTNHFSYGAGLAHLELPAKLKGEQTTQETTVYFKGMYKPIKYLWIVGETGLVDMDKLDVKTGVRIAVPVVWRIGLSVECLYSPITKRLEANSGILIMF